MNAIRSAMRAWLSENAPKSFAQQPAGELEDDEAM
jgi:hypothetical protein